RLVERLDLLDDRRVGLRRGLLFLAELAVVVGVELADQRGALLLALLELRALRLERRRNLAIGGLQRLRAGDDERRLGDADAVDLGGRRRGKHGGQRERGGGKVQSHQNWVPTVKEKVLVSSPSYETSG